MRILVILFVLICSCFNRVIGQPFFDVLSVSHLTGLPLTPSSPENQSVKSAVEGVDLSLPIELKKDVLVLGAGYENQYITFDNSDFHASVQSFKFPVAYFHQWKDSLWKTTFVGIGRHNSLVENKWNSTSLQYGGAIVFAREKKKNLIYKFGLYYNSEFFGPFFVPLLGLEFRVNKRLNIHGLLPGNMNVEYKLNTWLRTGLAFRSFTSSFRVKEKSFLRVNDNQLRLFLDFYLSKINVISIECGHSILREYKPGIRINHESIYTDQDSRDGLLLRVAYQLRFRLDEEKSTKQK